MNTNKERTQEQWLREEAYERRKQQREREKNDPEYAERLAKQRAYNKAWRERHPHYSQQWREQNPHCQRLYDKAWRERQTEDDKRRKNEYLRDWRAANSDYHREWRAAHPDYFKDWRKRKIEETRRKLNETKNEKRERIRKSLPIEARKALAALEELKNRKKEQRQE